MSERKTYEMTEYDAKLIQDGWRWTPEPLKRLGERMRFDYTTVEIIDDRRFTATSIVMEEQLKFENAINDKLQELTLRVSELEQDIEDLKDRLT